MTNLTEIDDRSPGVPHTTRRAGGALAVTHQRDAFGFAVMTALGAGLSLAATGFTFGAINNVFHLPIVAALYDAPQFADDVFIQSLRHFAAGPWRLLEGADRYVAPYALFLTLAVISRVVAFAGFLACAELLGVRSRVQRGLFVVLIATTGLMKGVSLAGGGALFVPDVTHSEIANGFILLSVCFAIRRRLDIALAMTGLTFFCNAFMGVWALAPVAAIAVAHLRQGDLTAAQALRQGVIGGAAFVAAAAPVIANVLGNPEFGAAPSIDYRVFLASYWPNHFLFWSISRNEALGLAMVVALAALAFHALGRRARLFQVALGAACAVYAAGMVAPTLTSSPTVLNLPLLRAGVVAQMLAALASAALATRWATGRDPWSAVVGAPALAGSLCLSPETFGFAPVLIYAARLPGVRRATSALPGATPWLRVAAALVVTGALAIQTHDSSAKSQVFNAAVGEWTAVADWAAKATPPDARFLPPVYDVRAPPETEGTEADRSWAAFTSVVFEYRARRRLWVDFKRGAAVMWTPSYYAVWRARINETLRLADLPARRAYAAGNGIDFVIDLCSASDGATPAFATAHLCVFAASPPPGS